MRSTLFSILLSILLFSTTFATSNTSSDVYALPTAADTARFNMLIGQFRCLVCQNESLADSNATLAADLRQQIYARVLQGQSDTDIRRYLVTRYGDYVLFEPPFTVNTTALWILPFLLVLGGTISLCIVIQRRKKA
jgi:cytochrome c-type biogenesis protein CcmH